MRGVVRLSRAPRTRICRDHVCRLGLDVDDEDLENQVDFEETKETVRAMREAAYEAVNQAKSR
jgi:hypothetical protein